MKLWKVHENLETELEEMIGYDKLNNESSVNSASKPNYLIKWVDKSKVEKYAPKNTKNPIEYFTSKLAKNLETKHNQSFEIEQMKESYDESVYAIKLTPNIKKNEQQYFLPFSKENI